MKILKKSTEMLRLRFYAETDVEIGKTHVDWQRYAEWLEALAIKELNKEMLMENEMLRNRMQEAMYALEKGITGRVKAHTKKAPQNRRSRKGQRP